ncbi:MAG: photosynthetic reaction center subunit H [Gammaproteobacteria bacterium]|jgi:photosynthetic reaction center H subunit|nr:photosynthetic reaction center subunit H [Gammaproteobacteria bacterium]
MEVGSITGYIDVAQLVLYLFWAFFFGLIIYLRREDKREGYPLDSERSQDVTVQGFPSMPRPKRFDLADGRTVYAPNPQQPQPVANAQPSAPWLGAPLEPVGDPMLAGIGPGSYAQRPNHPEVDGEGRPKIQPLRVLTQYSLDNGDPDPRGMPVKGADGAIAGTVADAWIDIEEPQIRYLEVELKDTPAEHVLLPFALAVVRNRQRDVWVASILGSQFVNVPRIANPDVVTLQEEELVVAYYGAGQLYANAKRAQPLV